MDYGIDLRYRSLHILTLLSLKLAKSAMIQARSDLIAIGKWWRACNSRAHAVDISASCYNSLKTYLFHFSIKLAHFEETIIRFLLWNFLSASSSKSSAKSCCGIQIFVAILWVTIHVKLHSVGGKTRVLTKCEAARRARHRARRARHARHIKNKKKIFKKYI